MNLDLEKVALRAVACKHWRWMHGMQLINPPVRSGATGYITRLAVHDYSSLLGEYPDLTDPATLGCLVDLVRRAWEPRLGKAVVPSPVCAAEGWGVGAQFSSEGFSYIVLPNHSSEVEALVFALEKV